MLKQEIKIRLVPNWCHSDTLRELWNRMTKNSDYQWNSIKVLSSFDDSLEDYQIILNYPKQDDIIVPSKSILLNTEPKSFKRPDDFNEDYPASNALLFIYGSKNNGRNNIDWKISKTYTQLLNEQVCKTKLLSCIISNRNNNSINKLILKILEYLDIYISDFDLYSPNPLPFRSYRNNLPYYCNDAGLLPYRYTFAAENTQEKGYFSDKITDAILSECLCFYWGCTDIEDYIDYRAYIRLDLNNPEYAINQIIDAIKNNEWEKRIEYIRKEKIKILNELQFFPTLEKIIYRIQTNKLMLVSINSHFDAYWINDGKYENKWNRIRDEFIKYNITVTSIDKSTINITPTKKWLLIMKDDIEISHYFVDYLHSHWNDISQETDIIYCGFYATNDFPSQNQHMFKISNDLSKKILDVYAYIIRSELFCSKIDDNLYTENLKIYGFGNMNDQRVEICVNNIDLCPSNKVTMWGPIKLRQYTDDNDIFNRARNERCSNNHAKSFEYLLELMSRGTINNKSVHYFNIWDELGTVAYYVNKKEEARNGFNKLVKLIEKRVPETIEAMKINEGRVIHNAEFYDCPNIHSRLKQLMNDIDNEGKLLVVPDSHYINANPKSRIMLTVCNSKYYDACRTQIASIHRTSFNSIDSYLVFDIGLTETEIIELQKLAKVTVVKLGDLIKCMSTNDNPQIAMDKYIKYYAFKIPMFYHLRNNLGLYFFLDAGAILLGDVKEVFDLIEENDIFMAHDENWYNYTWTHQKSIEAMKATESELESYQLCSGIIGWKGCGKYTNALEEAYKYSIMDECREGLYNHDYGTYKNNPILGYRFDQSILSIIRVRYGMPTWGNRYTAWESYENAISAGALIYVHRRKHICFDGLKYKMDADTNTNKPEIKIRLISNWCDNDELRELWNRMTPNNDYKWNNIKMIPWSDNSKEDYQIIINAPKSNDPPPILSKSIVFYMEPRTYVTPPPKYDDENPESNEILYIFGKLNNGRNNIEWHLSKTYRQLLNDPIVKTKTLSSITSGNKCYKGHQLRSEFLAYIDKNFDNFDLYGKHQLPLKSYRTSLPYYAKDDGLMPYKYTFSSENIDEKDYFTEKIVDAILSECLCFYWGCPNIGDYINSEAYIAIDIANPNDAIQVMKNAIDNNEWEKRIDIIRKEKIKILNELQFFPTLENILLNKIGRANKLTKSKARTIFQLARKYRLEGNNNKSFEYLSQLLNGTVSIDNDDDNRVYDFDLWDELGSVTYYVNRKDVGRQAFSKLIELVEANNSTTIKALQHAGGRILGNMRFFDCPELCEIFSKMIDRIKKELTIDDIKDNRHTDNQKYVIAFHDNQLCERGSTVALFDYAHYNEKILGNESIIMYNKNNSENNKNVVQKFHKRFKCFGYDNFGEVDEIIRRQGVDAIYLIKYGNRDHAITNIKTCKNLIHSVFTNEPHGDKYAFVSKWMTEYFDKSVPYIPHMIDLPSYDDNMRQILEIPNDAIVLGRYGGKETFDIDFVHEAIKKIASENQNIYFLFANTNRFASNHKQIIHIDTLVDGIDKVKFINTCDAMLHARHAGETFGLSIGEFSTLNKPIITYANSRERSHVNILGNKGIYYNNFDDLINILHNINSLITKESDWNCFKEYTNVKVMNKFREVFLTDYKIKITSDQYNCDHYSCNYNDTYMSAHKTTKNIMVVPLSNSNEDYYVVINHPHPSDMDHMKIVPSKCILLKKDDNVKSNNLVWDDPDPLNFLYVRNINKDQDILQEIAIILSNRKRQIEFINSKLDIYCINLKRSLERWKKCEEEFRKHGLNVKRYEAVDGNNISFEELLERNIVSKDIDSVTKIQNGALGLIASTVGLWQQISQNDTDKWTLILEDDIKFHPDILELFEKQWHIPDNADYIFLGFHYPWNCDPSDEQVLSNISTDYNKHMIKLHVTANGAYAYAINKNSAIKLLKHYVPVRWAVDKIPTHIFNVYGYKRPSPPNDKLVKNLYSDSAIWDGHSVVSLYGLAGTRSEKTTLDHIKYHCLYFIDGAINCGNFKKAYNYLEIMKQNISLYDQKTSNFTIWFKIINIAHQIDLKIGISAIEELINRSSIQEVKNAMLENEFELIESASYYNVPELVTILENIIDSWKVVDTRITLVTGLWNVDLENLSCLNNAEILSIKHPLIIFVQPNMVDWIKEQRKKYQEYTTIVPMEINELPYFDLNEKITNKLDKLDQLDQIIDRSKMPLVIKGINMNFYNSTHFGWVDFRINELCGRTLLKIVPDRIKILCTQAIDSEHSEYQLATGLFTGSIDNLHKLNEKCEKIIQSDVENESLPQQSVFSVCYVQYPELFELYYGSMKDIIVKYNVVKKMIYSNLLKWARDHRLAGNNNESLKYLLQLIDEWIVDKSLSDTSSNNKSRHNAYNFDVWDELSSVAYYAGRKDLARYGFSQLIELVERGNTETIIAVQEKGDRLLKNMRFYDCPEMCSKFENIMHSIKT